LADQQFFELINDCFLIQHVRTPTRGGNVLDLILTTEINMIENLVVMDPLGKSDHNTLVFDLVTQTYIKNKIQSYIYHKGDYNSMRNAVMGIEWNELFKGKDANQCWELFKIKIVEVIELYVPKSTRNKRRKSMWINRKTQKLLKKKYSFWKRFYNSGEYQDYERYKRIRNRAVKAVRAAKKKFEKNWRKVSNKILKLSMLMLDQKQKLRIK